MVAGESLWSVARAQLGSDASVRDLAAQVDRLWAVNAKRIRSGDPDLIDVGERLTLPSEDR